MNSLHIRRRQLLAFGGATLAALVGTRARAAEQAAAATGLRDVYKDDFLIGTALGTGIVKRPSPAQLDILRRDFNSITPENCMKWGEIRYPEGGWKWGDADAFVDFGMAHKLHMVGHTLMWHSQVPGSVFVNMDGELVSKQELLANLEEHIGTLVGRYKGKIAAWDVLNEAVDDDNRMRESPWYKLLGEDGYARAFHLAHEADPAAHLLYNDYNNELQGKRYTTIEFLKRLQKRGVPIHGVGMQAHIALNTPSLREFEDSIEAYARLGLRVHLTELDVDVLPSVWNLPSAEVSTRFQYRPERDPYATGLPEPVAQQLAARYEALFKVLIKHRDKIERVTWWGLSDDVSWLNDFPVRGRTAHPLLFDRKLQPKAAYQRLIALKG